MRLDGVWHLCDDEALRPVLHGEIRAADGSWIQTPFLIDTGADRTVLSADLLAALHLEAVSLPYRLGGAGGEVPSVLVRSELRFSQPTGTLVSFRGEFAAATQLEALDISVLGRDISGLFAVIIDRPREFVCMIGQRHRYTIEHD
jgi:Aspartyl protease